SGAGGKRRHYFVPEGSWLPRLLPSPREADQLFRVPTVPVQEKLREPSQLHLRARCGVSLKRKDAFLPSKLGSSVALNSRLPAAVERAPGPKKNQARQCKHESLNHLRLAQRKHRDYATEQHKSIL